MHLRVFFRVSFLISLFFLGISSYAQFQTGIYTSNYSGVMGIHLNPAGTSWLSDGADFSPAAVNAGIVNNNHYFEAQPLINKFNSNLFTVLSDTNTKAVTDNLRKLFAFKKDIQGLGYIFSNATIYGPSALINYRKKAYGITTAIKTYIGAIDINPVFQEILSDGIGKEKLDNVPFDMKNNRWTSVTFLDLGYNYSVRFIDGAERQWRFGYNLHFQIAHNAFYFNDRGAELEQLPDSSLKLRNTNFDYGFAFQNTSKGQNLYTPRAFGLGVDLGIIYVRKKHPSPQRVKKKCPNIYGWYREFQTYRWRAGASITDIGGLYFFNQSYSRQTGNYNRDWRRFDTLFVVGPFTFDNALRNTEHFGPTATVNESGSFFMMHPTMINLQFDAFLKPNLFLNLQLSQRVPPFLAASVLRANIATMSLRYETQFFELSVPVSVVEYSYPYVGMSARLGWFFFGTNSLPEWLGMRTIKGFDIYAGIKMNVGFIGNRFGMGF